MPLPLLAWALGDFSSVEARSILSSAMMPDSSCAGPGSGEGDASSASGDILTFPQFGYTSHTAPRLPGAQARSARLRPTPRAAVRWTVGRWLSIRANPRRWNRTTSLHDRNAGRGRRTTRAASWRRDYAVRRVVGLQITPAAFQSVWSGPRQLLPRWSGFPLSLTAPEGSGVCAT